MTPTVIDRLETVQIDHHHGKARAVVLRLGSDGVQLRQAITPVVKAGQRVDHCKAQAILHRGAHMVGIPLAPHQGMQPQGMPGMQPQGQGGAPKTIALQSTEGIVSMARTGQAVQPAGTGAIQQGASTLFWIVSLFIGVAIGALAYVVVRQM